MINLPEADLKVVEERLLKELREKIRRAVFATVAECLGSLDISILSALGVDVESKVLQIFLEESRGLLEQQYTGGHNGG